MQLRSKQEAEPKLAPGMFQFVQTDTELRDARFESEPIGYFKDAFLRFTQNRASVLATFCIAFIVIFSLLGPTLNPYAFDRTNTERINMPPKIPYLEKLGIADGSVTLYNRRVDNLSDQERYPQGSILKVLNERTVRGVQMADVRVDYYKLVGAGENERYWFGTDYVGRDLWTRLWRGARVSLFIAFVSVITNVVIGVIYGSIAGYYGGKVDMVMMRITEIIGALPRVVIMTIFIMFFGTGLFSIVMALVIQGWIGTAKMIRGQFYRFKGREYVLAARTLGVSDAVLIFRHILPNAIGPIITQSMIAIPGAIFSESFLAFLGLGLQAPEPSIGVLLSQGQKVLLHYPYQTFFPGVLISVLMISFNVFANGLRDAFDPTLRGAQ